MEGQAARTVEQPRGQGGQSSRSLSTPWLQLPALPPAPKLCRTWLGPRGPAPSSPVAQQVGHQAPHTAMGLERRFGIEAARPGQSDVAPPPTCPASLATAPGTHALLSQTGKIISSQEKENQGQSGKALGGEGWWGKRHRGLRSSLHSPQEAGAAPGHGNIFPPGASTLGSAFWAKGSKLFPAREGWMERLAPEGWPRGHQLLLSSCGPAGLFCSLWSLEVQASPLEGSAGPGKGGYACTTGHIKKSPGC